MKIEIKKTYDWKKLIIVFFIKHALFLLVSKTIKNGVGQNSK